MSIVVTCSCTKTYRLPDRYAGKRCRCRDCGRRIEVPADAEGEGEDDVHDAEVKKAAQRAKARAKKAKDDPSRTTRRLSSQDNEILGERRRLRSSQRTGPVSESMHQIAPMTLSGELPVVPPRAKKKKGKGAAGDASSATATKAPPKRKNKKGSAAADETKKSSRPTKRDRDRDAEREERRARERDRDEKKKPSSKARKAKRKRADVEDTDATDDVVGPQRGRRARTPKKTAKTSAVTAGRRKGRESGEHEAAPRGRATKRPYSIQAVLVIAGALTLGIGLVIGGLMSSKSEGAVAATGDAGAFDARFARLDAFKEQRDWAGAKAELDKLAADAKAAGAAQAIARARDEATTIDAMVQFAAIDDDETKVATLVQYAGHRDAALRLGVAMELKQLTESEEAQTALAGLARDADKRVAETARIGLIHAGGPASIPFLAAAIEQTAASGHKLGDIALERALEVQEPEIVPVLCTALKVRASAPAATLKKILEKLEDFADPSCKDAVTPYASHADEGVKTAAQAVLDAVRG